MYPQPLVVSTMDPEQEDYALKDVETLKMTVNETFDNVGTIPSTFWGQED
jgi:hypothetical protein